MRLNACVLCQSLSGSVSVCQAADKVSQLSQFTHVHLLPRILSLDKRGTPTLIHNSPPGGSPRRPVLGLKIYPTAILQFPVDNPAIDGDYGEYSTSRTAPTRTTYYALIYTHSSQKHRRFIATCDAPMPPPSRPIDVESTCLLSCTFGAPIKESAFRALGLSLKTQDSGAIRYSLGAPHDFVRAALAPSPSLGYTCQ